MTRFLFALALVLLLAVGIPPVHPAAPLRGDAQLAPRTMTLAERIAHNDPTKYERSYMAHHGAGRVDGMRLLDFRIDANAFDTNQFFLHCGVIEPKSGLGMHYHNLCEEMFVILDGEAQFTIDGRTSLLKGPAGAPVRMGHSHAIYNPTDKPVRYLNINVTRYRGVKDGIDLGDTREGAPLDAIPTFMTMRLDRSLLRPMNPAGVARGEVGYRRALEPSIFLTAWAYVDHLLLSAGAATTVAALPDVGETFYVMSGQGRVKAGAETAPLQTGDAIAVRMNEPKSFESTGSAPLELMVIGVSRDMTSKTALIMAAGTAELDQ